MTISEWSLLQLAEEMLKQDRRAHRIPDVLKILHENAPNITVGDLEAENYKQINRRNLRLAGYDSPKFAEGVKSEVRKFIQQRRFAEEQGDVDNQGPDTPSHQEKAKRAKRGSQSR
jgi:hypothetical protein